MPFRPELETLIAPITSPVRTGQAISSGWREKLPVLTGSQVVLRELRPSDATALFAMLTTDEVARFISPPPSTIEGFERFIAWTLRQRAAGAYVCFAVTLKGYDTPIGIFQVREVEANFTRAEWGFALGSPFWGSGVFQESAELVIEFVFNVLCVHRLEARAAVRNGRGHGALLKLGAVQEALMRKSFLRGGQFLDQVLYTIIEDEWRTARNAPARHSAFANVH